MPRARVGGRSSPAFFPCVRRLGWDGLVIWSVCMCMYMSSACKRGKGTGEGPNRMTLHCSSRSGCLARLAWPSMNLSLAWNPAGLQGYSIWIGALPSRIGWEDSIVTENGVRILLWDCIGCERGFGTSFDVKNPAGWGNVFFCWVRRAWWDQLFVGCALSQGWSKASGIILLSLLDSLDNVQGLERSRSAWASGLGVLKKARSESMMAPNAVICCTYFLVGEAMTMRLRGDSCSLPNALSYGICGICTQ